MKQMYMNPATGSVDTIDGWFYEDEDGKTLNAVDRGEVVPVHQGPDGSWVEGIDPGLQMARDLARGIWAGRFRELARDVQDSILDELRERADDQAAEDAARMG